MNKHILLATGIIFLSACGDKKTNTNDGTETNTTNAVTDTQVVQKAPEKKYVYKEVETIESFNLPAEQIWSMISTYDNLNAMVPELIVSCLVSMPKVEVGTVRTVTAADGSEIVHEITLYKPDEKEMRYKVLQNPFMTKDEEVLIKVTPKGEQACKLRLFTSFNAEEGTEDRVEKSAKELQDALVTFFKDQDTRQNINAPLNKEGIQ